MSTGKIIFSQLMDFIPWYEFQKCVQRYSGNYKSKTFTCQDQFRCMAFAQLTFHYHQEYIDIFQEIYPLQSLAISATSLLRLYGQFHPMVG